jgi:hypothetical protein
MDVLLAPIVALKLHHILSVRRVLRGLVLTSQVGLKWNWLSIAEAMLTG